MQKSQFKFSLLFVTLLTILLIFGILESIISAFLIWIIYTILRYNGLLPYQKSIVGKHIIITGAGQGIGKELALQLSRLYTKISILDINQQALNITKEEIKKQNQNIKIESYLCDVSNQQQIETVFQQCEEKFGFIDILINNAGIYNGGYLTVDNKIQTMENTMKINVFSQFYTTKYLLPKMIERKQGHIVALASFASMYPCPFLADYSASKFAVLGYYQALAAEIKAMNNDSVKFTCICPWAVDTKMAEFTEGAPGLRKQTPQSVAKRTIQGILQEEEIVIIPFLVNIIILIHQIVPTCISDTVLHILDKIEIQKYTKKRDQKLKQQ